MSDLNLTPALRKRFKPYPRKRGRYNSSELFGITKGYITPEKWVDPQPFNLASMMGMWNGMVVHDFVQKLLPSHCNEVKVVYEHELSPTETFSLVAKADHLPDDRDEVWEFKSSNKAHNKMTKSHEYQCKLYCTIHKRPKGKVFQPVQNEKGLFLKCIGEVERDDAWFAEQMNILGEFHRNVEKYIEEELGGQLPDANSSF